MQGNDSKERYIHRDLSWLAFNERVLEESTDPSNPLFERLRFMAIFSSNLDEFFMVRVAGAKRLVDGGVHSRDRFGWLPAELLARIRSRAKTLVDRLYDIHRKKIRRELEKKRIVIHKVETLSPAQSRFARNYFENALFPVITPIAVDQGHPFPVLFSGDIAFAVRLERYRKDHFAIVHLPRNLPRLLGLPAGEGESRFILIEDIVRQHLKRFFRGYRIADSILFRVIRDSELSIDEEYEEDLLRAIEAELRKRPRARVISLEVAHPFSNTLLETLCEGLGFEREQVTVIRGDLDLTYLFQLVDAVPRPELCFPRFVPAKIPYENIFEKIKERDFLLHLPYQSFYPVADLVQSAAQDPDVLAIKMTLYRTNEGSPMIQALKLAAENGKQVTVLVEIKARFDEGKNIRWVRELEESGCHVMYGIAGMKIHSKMLLIVRREAGKIRRYVHLSTGNYNAKTARIYTDCGYFTANDDFAKDISDVFNVITGYSVPARWKRIVSSPFDLREFFFELIDREIAYHRQYKNGRIFAKMNSLEDVRMIDKLYEASRAGVTVRLIVRGICCLVPGVPGMSENIEIMSLVGRFLEHARIYRFHNNGDARYFLASADWMHRNLDRRIELAFEIYDTAIKEQLGHVLETQWADDLKSRILLSDRGYVRRKRGIPPLNAQEELIRYYGNRV